MKTEDDYADVELRILPASAGGYAVEMTLDSEREFGPGALSAEIDDWVASGVPEEDGAALFGLLFADDAIKTGWAEIRGQFPRRRLRLRIDAEAPRLHAIPWELLRDEGGDAPVDLAAHVATPFSRYLAGTWHPGAPVFKRPLRVLVAIADPDFSDTELHQIEADKEWAVIDEATQAMQEAGTVELVRLPSPCTLSAIEAKLKEGFHVLHFAGHGAFSRRSQKAVLYMADADNQIALVESGDFAAMLGRQLANADTHREDQLRMVFLGSCETASMSRADAFRGFAPTLVAAGIPAVVAMQDKVPVDTAREFIKVFFTQLLAHGQVDRASNEARAALLTAERTGASMPVLYLRLRSGALLGQRGRVTSASGEKFWPYLYENIENGLCVPILGPRATTGLLPDAHEISEKLAAKYGYALADSHNLARVAAFIQVNDGDVIGSEYQKLLIRGLCAHLDLKPTPELKKQVRGKTLAEVIGSLDWSKRAREIMEDEPHHLLAELGLPLYLTTNPDSFMFEALKTWGEADGIVPRMETPRWRQTEASEPHYALSPTPDSEHPVVFHLNGLAGDRELVLSERDYLKHFVRVSRDLDTLLPTNVMDLMSRRSFLFLGYSLHDWEFRVVLEGLVPQLAQHGGGARNKIHVGVQLDAEEEADSTDEIRRYLGDYLKAGYSIDIYWGSVREFVSELNAGWETFLTEQDDDW